MAFAASTRQVLVACRVLVLEKNVRRDIQGRLFSESAGIFIRLVQADFCHQLTQFGFAEVLNESQASQRRTSVAAASLFSAVEGIEMTAHAGAGFIRLLATGGLRLR